MTTITRRFQFCAGHRILGHESKCAHMHGHNYVALVTVSAPGLDDLGRVVDFSVVKELVGGWIDKHWDHAFIVNANDEQAVAALSMIPGQRTCVMAQNPTAEVMAQALLHQANALLFPLDLNVTRVVLWETENCYAEVSS